MFKSEVTTWILKVGSHEGQVMKKYLKQLVVLVATVAMIICVSLQVIAMETSVRMNTWASEPIKLPDGVTAEDFVKNPDQPDLYTLRNEYMVERYGKKDVNYQPYVATVGAAATQAEKDKVSKTINLPTFVGYQKPSDSFTIDYQNIVSSATSPSGTKTGNEEYGFKYNARQEVLYPSLSGNIKVKHRFQDLKDFSQYGKKPGAANDIITTQEGKIGSLTLVKPLPDDQIAGFIPENKDIKVLISQTPHEVELRYNRAHFDVVYDTTEGTPVPTRTLYYGQEIPPINSKDIPTKEGGVFLGWKPSVDLKDKDGKTYNAGEIITKAGGKPIKDLNANLIMPAGGVKFTAAWKDKDKSEYTVLFWTEKSDYLEGASLADKYDYVGTHVYKNQNTGMRPNLENEPINGVEFPDLDQARLNKIYAGEKFYGDTKLFLNKFYFYNKELTDKENADPNNLSLTKAVSATDKTVYNIYYDRQVYDLYFTKSNVSTEPSFYPTIVRGGNVIGKPGAPFHFTARFNQRLNEWPNDALETKGFSEGKQSFGWGPNFNNPKWDYRDTPPYRLSAKDFLDMPEYDNRGGYTHTIDAGDGKTISVPHDNFTTLSFGIKEQPASMPHHMDFWMEGFEPGKWIIDYDLYRVKADTDSPGYLHPYPVVQGFTPYNPSERSIKHDEDWFNDENDERGLITPYPEEKISGPYGFTTKKGEMFYLNAFFNNADDYGDPLGGGERFQSNGYIQFKYRRNKYKLRFNISPSKYMDDSEFNSTNQTDVLYKKPLKELDLDNPETLKKMNLTGIIYTDSNGKLRVKKPDAIPENRVFKGWSLDPKGEKLVWANNETMPYHNLVLYAKWEEPDDKWKVTFDPNGGELPAIDAKTIVKNQKTILEGDIGQTKQVTYPTKREDDGKKQVFTVLQRQQLIEPAKPTRAGYSFVGWEVVHYKKDASGNYTDEQDNSYRENYKVPELYSFGNDVVSPIYLKAVWLPDNLEKVTVYHHFLDQHYHIDKTITDNPKSRVIDNQRVGQYTMTVGSEQSGKWFLAPHEELIRTTDPEVKKIYDEYNGRLNFNNTYFQHLRVEPQKILKNGQLVDNPNYKNNVFHFFYRPFETRNYKVNYVDEKAKAKLNKATTAAEKQAIMDEYRILDQEVVSSEAKHYDARNYKPISGWKLTSSPQQQLFYDIDKDTNEFKGINGSGSDEITFYYKDVRMIEVPKGSKIPDGYIRVTFRASEGGSFGKDKDGKPIKEINYDVVKGLKASMIPIPQQLKGASEENKYYITPEENSKFIKWDNKPLSGLGTFIDNTEKDYYVFTANFNWDDVIEQTGKNKPITPASYVKVIVKTTSKATDKTAFEKTFWVNPAKAVKIPVDNPVGKADQKVTAADGSKQNVTYTFKNWQKVKTGASDDELHDVSSDKSIDLAKHQYVDKVTVVEADYGATFYTEPTANPNPNTNMNNPKPNANANNPKTEDQSRIYLWLTTLVCSILAMFALCIKMKHAANKKRRAAASAKIKK